MMKVAIIGAGNVATHLARVLRRSEVTISGVWSRTADSAIRLSKIAIAPSFTDLKLLPEADFYIISLPDKVLEEVLADLAPLVPPKSILLHTAGSIPMDVFKGKTERYGVLYPLQTFSKNGKQLKRKFPCFIEGSDSDTLSRIHNLACKITNDVRPLDSEKRRHLHLAAVFACNFVNHCYAVAASLLEEQGIRPDCLLPLAEETARKLDDMSPLEAQTGPAVRGDDNVIAAHLDMLAPHPDFMAIYKEMSTGIQSLKNRSLQV